LRAEAGEHVSLLDRYLDCRAHDWLVVTLLTDPLLELLLDDCELVSDPKLLVSDPELDVVVAGDEDDATVLADERLASAGSCPDTSTTAISSQAATNSATAPPTMRRRIMLARLRRALRIAWPRARAAAGSLSVMFQVPRSQITGEACR
jgi:hypothetical protein